MIKPILAPIIFTLITACAVPVPQDAINSASFGPEPIKEDYMARINGHLQEVLLDPESLILNCFDAVKGWARRNVLDAPIFGWLVVCDVNGKNRFGGYTGGKPYAFVFNGTRASVIEPSYLDNQMNQKVGVVD
jgi:hypothetical protein